MAWRRPFEQLARVVDIMANKPPVCIGLPVFNGETFLEAALASVLAQTYRDFEFIISDNASTDRTADICRSYAASDRRISFTNNEVNLGAAFNFNKVFHLSSSPYFKWMAHDDLIDPQFLEHCVAVLERDPSVVLCHTKVKVIDENGDFVSKFAIERSRFDDPSAVVRFGDLIMTDLRCYEIFGLIRASALRRTPLIGAYAGSDRPLRAELGLLGRFQEVPEHLMISRDHPGRSTRAMPAHHMRLGWFDPAQEGRRCFPHWRLLGEYVKTVERAAPGSRDRALCLLHVAHWIGRNLTWAWMLVDVVIAITPGIWTALSRLRSLKRRWFGVSAFRIQD
jgi:hypothetical protein